MGSVMMSKVSSTSITSIKGVVFISTITSPSPLSLPIFIAMGRYLQMPSLLRGVSGFGEKADFRNSGQLTGEYDTSDGFEANILVAADVNFRIGMAGCDGTAQRILEAELELALVDRFVVVIDVFVLIDRDDNVLR